MSKIVIDAREYTTSTGRYVSNLVHNLEQLDTANDYVILLRPTDMAAAVFTNPHFTKLACPYKEFTFSEQIGLLRQVRQLKADLVHFAIVQQPVLYTGKKVTTFHDLTTIRFRNPAKNRLVFTLKQYVYRWVNKRVAKSSQAILTGSGFVKQDVARFTGVAADKITVTYEAADAIYEAAEALERLSGERFIMYIGRPTPHKNLERLVDAFRLLQQQYPELKLVLAGKKDSNYQRIETKIRQLGMETSVVFTDFVSEGQLRWLYENCAAYVFPSLSEGFGLPGLEAMVHGAPVVSSNATCLPEIYGDAAHYFDPTDTQAMADAINEVLTNKALRQRLTSRGKQQAAKYSWRRMSEQTLAVYNRILQS